MTGSKFTNETHNAGSAQWLKNTEVTSAVSPKFTNKTVNRNSASAQSGPCGAAAQGLDQANIVHVEWTSRCAIRPF